MRGTVSVFEVWGARAAAERRMQDIAMPSS